MLIASCSPLSSRENSSVEEEQRAGLKERQVMQGQARVAFGGSQLEA